MKWIVFFLLSLSLFADEQATLCADKLAKSTTSFKYFDAIAISRTRSLVINSYEHSSFIKWDPFLGLGLIKHKNKIFLDIRGNCKKKFLYGNRKKLKNSRFISYQIGLNIPAKLNTENRSGSVLMAKCCTLIGISGSFGLIDIDFLDNFLRSSSVLYRDLGMKIDKYCKVIAVNPFLKPRFFHKNDILVSVNGYKGGASELMKKILFNKKKTIKVVIKRDNKYIHKKLKLKAPLNGGLIEDSYLRQLGISFDKTLKIKSLQRDSIFYKFGLKIDDQVQSVDRKMINNLKELEDVLSDWITDKKDEHYFLIKRKEFNFFIKISENL
jgi:hypothetical protein